MAETAGLDFSMARPTPAAVVKAGFRFVMGYVSTSPAKNLTGQNVRDYLAAGLSVGLVWENTADRALAGAAAGAADGAAADAQADALGYPVDSVIFFAVDLAVSLSQINGPIRAYAVAFDAAMKRPSGVYGSFLVVETLVTPGQRPVRYGWQTAAWSAGALSTKANLYQRAAPSGHWPVIPGTDENVLCAPLPLAAPSNPTPPPGGFLMALTDAQQAEMYNDLRLVVTQLCGATYLTDGKWGWPLPDGTKKTPVDMLRALYAAPPNLTAADIAAAVPADLVQAVIDALGKLRITTTPAA